MATPYQSNIEYSRSLQEKFEYYLIALNFTLLALSVQTAEFSTEKPQVICELAGWVILFLAGVVGLVRLGWQPVAHKNFAIINMRETNIEKLRAAQLSGSKEVVLQDSNYESVPIGEFIEKAERSFNKNKPRVKALEDKLKKQYQWHKYLFLAGVVLIMASRAYLPLVDIVGELTETAWWNWQ